MLNSGDKKASTARSIRVMFSETNERDHSKIFWKGIGERFKETPDFTTVTVDGRKQRSNSFKAQKTKS